MIEGRRVLVVGGSSGIGRAIGIAAADGGAQVAFAARRRDELDDAVGAAGEPAIAVPCDVRDEAAVARAVEATVGAFGALDTVVYAAGTSPLAPLPEADADVWRTTFETNVVGAALVLRAALPHLRDAADPRVAVLSSHSVADPWPGLVPYVASKAALDSFVHGWRAEVPDVPVTRVVVGPTATGFADGWDDDLAARMFARWADEGRLPDDPSVMRPADVATEVLHALASPTAITDLRLLPPGQA